MKNEGPKLERLTHRLAECPAEMLEEPRFGSRGVVHVDAVVNDLVMDLGGAPPDAKRLEKLTRGDSYYRNIYRLVLIACWVLHDECFTGRKGHAARAADFLIDGLDETAALVDAELFVTDPERREELVRLCLESLELRPGGETENQARDRLDNLSSVVRARVINATREKQERARRLRQQMAEQRAREAAAKYNRE